MTPHSYAAFRKWLDEQIEIAGASVSGELHHAPHTYRHGCRHGELTALLDVRAYFTGETP